MNAYSSISNSSVIQYNSRAEINKPRVEEKRANGRDNTKNWVVNSFYRSKPAQGGRKSSTTAPSATDNTPSEQAERWWQERERGATRASPTSPATTKPIHFDQYVVDVTAGRFKFCLVGKFPESRPGLEQIRKWAGMAWALEGEWSITLLSHSHVFIRLCNKNDMIYVWGQNRWLVLGHLMKVFRWSAAYRPSGEDPSQAAVWVLFPSLPIVYFVEDLLHRIVSSIGEVLCMDEPTKTLTRTHFARVCVVVDLLAELPSKIWIGVGRGGFSQDVSYEKLPFYCSNCHLQGDHAANNCKVAIPGDSGVVSTQGAASGPALNQQSEITSVPPSDLFSEIGPSRGSMEGTRSGVSQNLSRHDISGGMQQLKKKKKKNKQVIEPSSQPYRPTKTSWSTEIEPLPKERAEERTLPDTGKDSVNIKDQHPQENSSKNRRVGGTRSLNWRIFFCWRKKLEPSDTHEPSSSIITRSFTEHRKLSVIKESAEPWKDAAMANSTTPLTLWKPVANEIRPAILHKYKRKEIVKMTSSFRETLGKGGSCTVYLGELINHGYVAVKLYTPNTPHGEHLFQNEMNVATMPSHSNIVKVLGFCCEESTRALVLEYAPLGALDKLIYSDNLTARYRSFSCHEKYQIAVGLAKGIDHLHTGCNVLHRDIKPSNVLLDENLCPKIADFGLSIAMQTQSSFTVTTLRGTLGYLAPEALSMERMSSKIDIYGYGIVLLEMLMRRKPYGDRLFRDNEHIVDLAYKVLNGQDGLGLEGYVPDSEMEVGQKMMQVALLCTQAKAESRPSMAKVLDMLEGHVDHIAAPPPNPSTSDSHFAIGVFTQDSSRATMTFSTIDGR